MNVTLDDIGKLLPLLDLSPMGKREQHPCGDVENNFTLQTRVEIDMVELKSKAINEVKSVCYTLTLLLVHCKEG